MYNFEIVLALLVGVALLALLARRLTVPTPAILVAGGLLVALLPGLPAVRFDPQLVFLVFIPPLLYRASLLASYRDVRANLRPILSLGVGHVLFATLAVAWVAHRTVPGLPWASAFVRGAVVSPPDVAAATAFLRRLPMPRRVVTVLEGESMVNDAAAIVAYRMAIAAAVSGTFSLGEASMRFLAVGAGGIVVGLAVGWLLTQLRPEPPHPQPQASMRVLAGGAGGLGVGPAGGGALALDAGAPRAPPPPARGEHAVLGRGCRGHRRRAGGGVALGAAASSHPRSRGREHDLAVDRVRGVSARRAPRGVGHLGGRGDGTLPQPGGPTVRGGRHPGPEFRHVGRRRVPARGAHLHRHGPVAAAHPRQPRRCGRAGAGAGRPARESRGDRRAVGMDLPCGEFSLAFWSAAAAARAAAAVADPHGRRLGRLAPRRFAYPRRRRSHHHGGRGPVPRARRHHRYQLRRDPRDAAGTGIHPRAPVALARRARDGRGGAP